MRGIIDRRDAPEHHMRSIRGKRRVKTVDQRVGQFLHTEVRHVDYRETPRLSLTASAYHDALPVGSPLWKCALNHSCQQRTGFGSIGVAVYQFLVSTSHNAPAIGREGDNLHGLVRKQEFLLSGIYVELDEIAARDLAAGKNLPAVRARRRPTVNRRPLGQLHRRMAGQYSQILHPNPAGPLKNEIASIGCPTADAALSPRLAIFKKTPQTSAVGGGLP